MREVLGHPRPTTPGRLPGYERREGRWPYLLVRTDIPGPLPRGVSADDFAKLEAHEDVEPQLRDGTIRRLYTRERITVPGPDDRPVTSWVYLPDPANWKPKWR